MAKQIVSRGQKHVIERDPTWPAGRHEATFTISDQHYHDGAQWQPVNESLVDDGADGFAKKCDTTRHIFRIANGGQRRWYPRRNVTSEYIAITDIEYWRTQGGGSWRNIALPTPVWRGNGADWDLANLSVSLTNTWHRIKADFVLKDETAPTRLRFAVSFVGLTLGSDWHLTSTTDSEIVGSIDPPTAEDATGAAVPVSATYAGGYIEWSADTAGATYPVTVDPTFTDGNGGDVDTAYDTYVQENDPTFPFPTATGLFFLSTAGNRRFGLFLFDLSSIDDSATIDSAYLHLRNGFTTGTTIDYAVNAILSANSGWLEGCNWNYADGTTATDRWAGDTGNNGGTDAGCSVSGTDYNGTAMGTFSLTSSDSTDTDKSISLNTTQVAGWLTANYGCVVRCTTASIYDNHPWRSSDYATTAYRPKLVVTYTVGGKALPPFQRPFRIWTVRR